MGKPRRLADVPFAACVRSATDWLGLGLANRIVSAAMPTDVASDQLSYAYRPSLLGAGWEFSLGLHGLDWSRGERSGHVPYTAIRRIRISYRPMSMQTHRFVTEVVADNAPYLRIVSTSWKSLVEQERFDAAYSEFVRELHRHVAERNPTVICERGRPPYLYWPGLGCFAIIVAGLALLVLRALQAHATLAAVLIALFLVLFAWQGGRFFQRNWPGAYSPHAVPPELLPTKTS
jgi:hypothetical protein